MSSELVVLAFVLVVALLVLRTVVHIVPEYQRLVVFALGRYQKTSGPGLVLLLPPPIQSSVTVDLREFSVEIPQQTCITKDNATISIDFLIFQQVVEASDSVIKVQNFRQQVQQIASTTLRAVIGDLVLDDAFAKREQMNEVLRIKLDDRRRQGHHVAVLRGTEGARRLAGDEVHHPVGVQRARRTPRRDGEKRGRAAREDGLTAAEADEGQPRPARRRAVPTFRLRPDRHRPGQAALPERRIDARRGRAERRAEGCSRAARGRREGKGDGNGHGAPRDGELPAPKTPLGTGVRIIERPFELSRGR